MDSIISMIEGGSVIVVAVLCCVFFGERLRGSLWLGGIVYGIVFAVTGAIVMSNSVELIPGVRTDPRNAVAVLSGAIGGPISALISAIVMMAIRWSYGGLGAIAGAASIGTAALSSVILWAWWTKWRGFAPSKLYIFYQALIAGIVPTITIFILAQVPIEIVLRSASMFVPTNFLAVLLLGGLIIAEQQRRWAIKSKVEMEAHLVAIANNAPGMLFQMTLDDRGRLCFPYVSEGSRKIFGIRRQRFLETPDFLYGLLNETDRARLMHLLETSAESRNRWSFEATYQHPTRELVWLQLSAEPRVDSHERLVWDGSISDITTQKRNERMKNEFVATVSHELRTPLTSIHGALSLLASGSQGKMPESVDRLLGLALQNSERLKNLVDDILDIEKIESGSMPFELSPTAFDGLIEEAIEGSANYRSSDDVAIEFHNEAPGLAGLVDADRFNQIIANLLSNALKFSPSGGTVTVRLKENDGKARISITDEGAGIPASFHHRLFEKFEQVDSADNRTKGGTGLGLNICKAIVERMDGAIDFDTAMGEGTTFIVEFPIVEMASDAADMTGRLSDSLRQKLNEAEAGETVVPLGKHEAFSR
ncbi:ATP-binding protein [Notoacmeibacter sp. MSK16QG-6]|uniref:ATP-binding protein n=1 Tax=Notoacmeibacter sp. MSK16QG-6 TaxID=2957982 RepID=UPI0020A148CD|nr:ATP-binding protein [Notoacmeibacter sp. MSK16QG-6]MCP1198575.1 PAS domain-containing sensor histidine kinase [Notoacmeibacter sp. MSK16QG-6]